MHSVGDCEGPLPECSIGYWSWDDWSWSIHGNLLYVCYRSSTVGCPQAVQISIMTVVERSLQDSKDHA